MSYLWGDTCLHSYLSRGKTSLFHVVFDLFLSDIYEGFPFFLVLSLCNLDDLGSSACFLNLLGCPVLLKQKFLDPVVYLVQSIVSFTTHLENLVEWKGRDQVLILGRRQVFCDA